MGIPVKSPLDIQCLNVAGCFNLQILSDWEW